MVRFLFALIFCDYTEFCIFSNYLFFSHIENGLRLMLNHGGFKVKSC